jgi:hypothetical protein
MKSFGFAAAPLKWPRSHKHTDHFHFHFLGASNIKNLLKRDATLAMPRSAASHLQRGNIIFHNLNTNSASHIAVTQVLAIQLLKDMESNLNNYFITSKLQFA